MIVPYAPGGNADIMARLVGQRLGENSASRSSSTTAPARAVSSAPTRGQSAARRLFDRAVASSLATNPSLIKTLPYDANRDLAPITMVGSTPLILAAYPGLAASNVEGTRRAGESETGPVELRILRSRLAANLAGTLFNFMTGINIVHVRTKAQRRRPPTCWAATSRCFTRA